MTGVTTVCGALVACRCFAITIAKEEFSALAMGPLLEEEVRLVLGADAPALAEPACGAGEEEEETVEQGGVDIAFKAPSSDMWTSFGSSYNIHLH
jgi:hypothetical protein